MKLDLGFSLIGGSNSKDQKYIHITLKDVLKRINEHPAIDPWTKDFLRTKVREYPDDALIFFVQNINQIVTTALNERNRILKEQYAEHQESQCKIDQPVNLELCGSSGAGVEENKRETKQAQKSPERENLFSKRSASRS